MIKDSGNRRKFATGAVRDIQEGKGRFDLLPMCVLLRLAKHYEEGCHSTCEEYKAFRSKRDAENAEIFKKKQKEVAIAEHNAKVWLKHKKGALR